MKVALLVSALWAGGAAAISAESSRARDQGATAPAPMTLSPPDLRRALTVAEKGAVREIKEWQAIMDYLRSLPAKNEGELPTIPVDDRAAEVRAIRAG